MKINTPTISDAKEDTEEQEEKVDISKLCCCLERQGDNPNCPVHGHLYRE